MITRQHEGRDGKVSLAYYSDCGTYRYWLQQRWQPSGKALAFIMLNPSTATEIHADPTINRCLWRARAGGYARLVVTNLFAMRAKDPEDMKVHPEPIGADNDCFLDTLIQLVRGGGMDLICGWGVHGAHQARGSEVLRFIEGRGIQPMALHWTQDGHPAHPLYLAYSRIPVLRPTPARSAD